MQETAGLEVSSLKWLLISLTSGYGIYGSLTEFLSKGSISDHIYYLNRSCYNRLPEGLRSELDMYLDECEKIYTKSSFRQLKIQCSSIILILISENPHIYSIKDISYIDIERLAENDYSRKSYGRNTYMNYAHRMFWYFGEHGLCRKGYGVITSMKYHTQVGNPDTFSRVHKNVCERSAADSKGTDAERLSNRVTGIRYRKS